MPSRASVSQSKSIMVTMILFLILFLAAVIVAVILYMNIEQYRKEAEQAQQALAEIGTDSQLRTIKAVAAGKGTALGTISDDMAYMAELIGGEELARLELTGIRVAVENQIAPLEEQLATALANPEEADLSNGLVTIMQTLIAERNSWVERFSQTASEQLTLERATQQRIETLQEQVNQLTIELAEASAQIQTYEEDYGDLKTKLQETYESDVEQLKQQIAQAKQTEQKAQDEASQLKQKLVEYEMELVNLRERLRLVQPNPDMEMMVLEPDGYVVRVVPRDNLAYISLSKDDHIYRGLTFSVYDRYQSIPKHGRGKGTLEVLEIKDAISKCRITHFDPTNPIMANDVIANVVWSENMKYQFCVVGEFDFNQDGDPDTDGRARIVQLIKSWGGETTEDISVNTDFCVIGQPYDLPPKPAERELELNTEFATAYKESKQRLDRYHRVRDEASSLGVPQFNLTRFLHFIGYYDNQTG